MINIILFDDFIQEENSSKKDIEVACIEKCSTREIDFAFW